MGHGNHSDLSPPGDHPSKSDWALEELLEQARPRLWNWLVRRGADPGVVPDLIQEILIKTWEARRQWDPQRGFWPWLQRIAMNHYGDWQRGKSRDPLAHASSWEESAPLENEAAEDPSPEEQFIRSELNGEVRLALMKLPPKYREVLWLYYLEGCNCTEVANTLNLTVTQVEGRLFRGRSRLRASLQSSLGIKAS